MTQLHERVLISQKAGAEIKLEIGNILNKYELHYDDTIQVYGQSIANLTLKEKVILGEFHREVEECLSKYTEQYSLTIGEKIRILCDILQNDAKYLIRWERHGDFDKEGDFA